MLRTASLIFILACAAPAFCADAGPNVSLIPEGVRAMATPDDCAIILVSDPTNGIGTGLQWLGIGGAIACNADNSIIVWSGSNAPSSGNFLWPEGIEDARPFDLDNSIIIGPASAGPGDPRTADSSLRSE